MPRREGIHGIGLASGMEGGGAAVIGDANMLHNLIAYWPGNEAAGNLIDAHSHGLDMTDMNTVTSNPGIVYALARQYTRVNTEYHVRPGDDALLSIGSDADYTWATWIRMDSNAANMDVFAKQQGGQREYVLFYYTVPNRLRWLTFDSVGAGYNVDANTYGAPPINTWMFVVCGNEAVTPLSFIQIDNGGVDSIAGFAVGADSTAQCAIGTATNNPALSAWDGRIGPTAFWKSAPGGGGCLTANQRTWLWNGGAGRQYSEFATGPGT